MPPAWPPKAVNDLIQSIIAHGNLSEATERNPFGKVCNWPSVYDDMMNSRGHAYSKVSMQSQWSREANGRLKAAHANAIIPPGASQTQVLAIAAGLDQEAGAQDRAQGLVQGPVQEPVRESVQEPRSVDPIECVKDHYRRMTKQGRLDALVTLEQHSRVLRDVMEEVDG
ncbi:hypothetical protein HD806DRAFT_483366 [Xylariaceae sp. AK1471]|nr:hypothetical protein HD806DRAFT_483366 [Xylariaceae sp. AK1471]